MKLHLLPAWRAVLLFLFLWVTNTETTAQNGRYEVRFTVKTANCAARKVQIALQVRAGSMATSFNMGDANYRFDYDPRQIRNPRIAVQANFSNIAPSSDANYGPHNLNGSSVGTTIGTVSLNTFYTGALQSAKRVDTTWTTVSCVEFEVLNGADCFGLTWHDDQRFPITGMNEVELLQNGDYNLYVVTANGVFGNLQSCLTTNCPTNAPPVVSVFPPISTFPDSTVTVCATITDPDPNSTFTTRLCNTPTHGTATPSVNGNQVCVQFVPNGTTTTQPDSVCVEVCDNAGACVQVRIPVTVSPRPSAPTVTPFNPVTTYPDSTITVCSTISDPDGGTFTATLCNAPQGGTATPSVNGNQVCVTFVPNGTYTGATSVCVRVCDNTGRCVETTLPITISPRPSAPTVTPFNPVTTWRDSTITVCSTVSDPDGGTFTATLCNVPQGGTATPSVNGNQVCVTFVPNGTYTGATNVCVRVCDNTGRCVETTLPITIGSRPAAPTVTPFNPVVTYPDSTITVCSTISDPDGGTFTATLCNAPQGGTATPSVNGNQVCVTFVPNGTYTGATSVCVRVCDNTGRCVETTLPITISPRPTAPTVRPFNPAIIHPDSTVIVCSTISDPDGGIFTVTLCNTPLGGTATTTVNGNQVCITFVPNGMFRGETSVCVRVCDNTGRCVETTLPITISPRGSMPTVTPFNPVVTYPDSIITVCTTVSDPDGGTFTTTLCNVPQGGTATPSVNGNQLCVRFAPNGSFTGQTSVCVRVCDNTGRCVETTLPITINPRPRVPTVTPFAPVTTWIDSTITVCSPVSDPDGGTLNATICNTPLGGVATTRIVDGQVCVTFVPNGTFTGETNICVRVCDNTGLCTTVNIPVTVNERPSHIGINPPDPFVIWSDSTLVICATINDYVGNTFTATLCNTPAGGTATYSITGNQLCVRYTPNLNFEGPTSICVRVCNQRNQCTTTFIQGTVNIRPVIDPRTIIAMRKVLAPTQSRTVKLGKAIDYQIIVKNNSTFALTNVLVTDSIPTGLVLNQSNVQGWSLNASQRVASKTVARLVAGDSVILPISMVLIQGQPQTSIINRAFVLDAIGQAGTDIIPDGLELRDSASFTISPFDPMGAIYCENTGFILRGGKIELTAAPNGGQIIFVNDTNGNPLDGRNGQYQFFTNGVPGVYSVRYVHPNGFPLSSRCTAGATALDPTNNDGDTNDANGDGIRDRDGIVNDILQLGSNTIAGDHLQDFNCAQNPFYLNFNLATGDPFVFNNNIPIACAVIIGSTVGVDLNENGILDGLEGGLAGVRVELYRTSDLTTPLATTETDANGKYIFDGLAQGSYKIKFITPNGYRFTIQNTGDDTRDSDADPVTGWTQDITLAWGDSETTVGAHFVRQNAPVIAGYKIDTIENTVLNICIPIQDANVNETFTPSVCGVQNGTISNVSVNNRQLCFRYTPVQGYRGGDTLCLRVCDASGACDTALFPINLRAGSGGGRLDCATDTVAPTITLTNPQLLLRGVRSGDTLAFDCQNPPLFGPNDARATDNRDPRPRMSFVDIGVRTGSCPRDGFKVLMECEWQATDSCGNIGRFKIFVKITDNTPPTLVNVPAHLTVNMDLNEPMPAAPNVTATDACGTARVVLWVDTIPNTGCNYTLKRMWTAIDDCGNTSVGTQNITVLKTCACVTPTAIPNVTDATCSQSNGSVTLIIDNAANYTFTWSNGLGTGATKTGLAAGNYSVTISRVNNVNCFKIWQITVNNDLSNCCTTPVATPSVTAATCNQSNGAATIVVDNVANYTFNWSNGLGFGTSKTGLTAGNYSVTVSRNGIANCSTVVNLTINNDLSNCCVTPIATALKADETCGNANGSVTIQVDNPANYSFTWSANTPAGGFNNMRNGLAAGNYSVTVARSNNSACSTVVAITILNNTANCCINPIATVTKTDETCGSINGTATVNVDNPANYTFTWSHVLGTGQSKTGLAAGNYSVTVARATMASCSTVVNITILNNTQNCCRDFIPATSIVHINNGACSNAAEVCIQTLAQVIGVRVNDSIYTRGLTICNGGYAVKLFEGTNRVVFKNTEGCDDTVFVKVVCVQTRSQIVETTMIRAQRDTMLLQTSELYGSRFSVTITNKTNTGAVQYSSLGGTTAIVCHALEYGADDAFAVVRDEYGVTDTTYLRTFVVSPQAKRSPAPQNDVVTTRKNKSISIDVLSNDSTLGILRGVFSASQPKNGQIVVANNKVTYIPKVNFCGLDEFSYSLCNQNGCSTAKVTVKVLCDGLRVLNGFSPNGDNTNDVLVIEGIEEYPNNVLKVFNRWGNEVLNVKGYKNDWGGTWNSAPLPDGTYFYVLNDGKGQQYSGYIYLTR